MLLLVLLVVPLQRGALDEAEKWKRVCEGLEARLVLQLSTSVHAAEAAATTPAALGGSAPTKPSKLEREASLRSRVPTLEEPSTVATDIPSSPVTPSSATPAAKGTSQALPPTGVRGRSPSGLARPMSPPPTSAAAGGSVPEQAASKDA